MDEMTARLQALEDRVQALEARASPVGPAPTPAPTSNPGAAPVASQGPGATPEGGAGAVGEPSPDDRFWALDGLKARLDALPAAAAGGVLFTGTVRLAEGPVEWQMATLAGELLDSEWSEFADALGALGHPVRLRLLQAIATGTRASAQLQELPGLGTSGQIYHHLRALTQAGWLRAGTRGHWSVPPERLVPLLVVLAAAWR